MDKVIKNYEEKIIKPMTTKEFFYHLIEKRKAKKHNKKHHNVTVQQEHVHDESCVNEAPKDIKVISLAIVIDDVVVDIMNVQDNFSEILLKNPKFIKLEKKQQRPQPGWMYVDEKFIPFEEVMRESGITMRNSS